MEEIETVVTSTYTITISLKTFAIAILKDFDACNFPLCEELGYPHFERQLRMSLQFQRSSRNCLGSESSG